MPTDNSLIKKLIGEVKKIPFDVESIMLCGSVVAKLNISASDIDIVVIVKSFASVFGKAEERSSVVHQSILVESKRFDLMLIDKVYYKESLDLIMNNGRLFDNRLNIDKFIIINLIYGNDNYNKLIQSFNFEEFKHKFIEGHHEQFLNAYEDLKGAVQGNDVELSVIWGRRAVTVILEAFLCASGDYYSREKWQYKRLQRLGRCGFLPAMYKNLIVSCPPSNESELKEWCLDLMTYCFMLSVSAVSVDYTEKLYHFFKKNKLTDWLALGCISGRNILITGTKVYEIEKTISINDFINAISNITSLRFS